MKEIGLVMAEIASSLCMTVSKGAGPVRRWRGNGARAPDPFPREGGSAAVRGISSRRTYVRRRRGHVAYGQRRRGHLGIIHLRANYT